MILIAEDNLSVANYLSTHLRRLGHEVVVANTGEEAWSKLMAQSKSIKLLCTDISMPGMSGLDLVAKMRTTNCVAHIPVIFASGTVSFDVVKQAGKLTNIHFVVKPLKMDNLLPKIMELMPTSVPFLLPKEQMKREYNLTDAQYYKIIKEFLEDVERGIQSVKDGLKNFSLPEQLREVESLSEGADLVGAIKFRQFLQSPGWQERCDAEEMLTEMRTLVEALKQVLR